MRWLTDNELEAFVGRVETLRTTETIDGHEVEILDGAKLSWLISQAPAALAELRVLRALATAATALWEADDSPAPNAQLMYEDAKFDVFKALEAWRAGRES